MFSYLKSFSERTSLRYLKKYPFLGLDLGFNEVRLLQLEHREGTYHIEKIEAHPFSGEGFGQEKTKSWAELREFLAELISRRGLNGSSVAFALAASTLVRKQLELPAHFSEDELMHELRLRLGQHFPGVAEKEVYFDYSLRLLSEDKRQITLFAVGRSQLQRQLEFLIQIGLKPKIVDVDLYALARGGARYFYKNQEGKNETALLLDLCFSFCTLIVFFQEDLIFHYQWRADRAILEGSSASHSMLIQEVKKAWQLFRASHSKLKIEFFGLSGELEGLKQFSLQLQNEISLSVQLINPFQNMTYASGLKIEAISKLSSRFLLCCGLALRGFCHGRA